MVRPRLSASMAGTLDAADEALRRGDIQPDDTPTLMGNFDRTGTCEESAIDTE